MVTTTFEMKEYEVLVSYQKDTVFVGTPSKVRKYILEVVRAEAFVPTGERSILNEGTHEVVDAFWSGESTSSEWRLWVVARTNVMACSDCSENESDIYHSDHQYETEYDFKVQEPWKLWVQQTKF